jgi:hypothetical protein
LLAFLRRQSVGVPEKVAVAEKPDYRSRLTAGGAVRDFFRAPHHDGLSADRTIVAATLFQPPDPS